MPETSEPRRLTATLWDTPRGGHTGALHAAPGEYARRVVGFLDRALLGAP